MLISPLERSGHPDHLLIDGASPGSVSLNIFGMSGVGIGHAGTGTWRASVAWRTLHSVIKVIHSEIHWIPTFGSLKGFLLALKIHHGLEILLAVSEMGFYGSEAASVAHIFEPMFVVLQSEIVSEEFFLGWYWE